MMLLIPVLTGADASPWALFGFVMVHAVVLVVLIAASTGIPLLGHQMVRMRSHELLILSVVALCFGTAWLTSQAGLSLALGAFGGSATA